MNPAQQFLSLSPERRDRAFVDASTRRGVHAAILEKDFWVCWLLGTLFMEGDLGPQLVFKGGTSLAKVFDAIDRFSEDVDLSVSPAFVGADAEAFRNLSSRTRRDAAIAETQRLCSATVRDVVGPRLEAVIRKVLGSPANARNWLAFELDPRAQSPNLYFAYPSSQTTGVPYIRRNVKLEMGSLTDQQPVGRHTVRPWVAEDFPSVFEDWRCEVIALELPRTFWEKATILHAEYHRPEDQPLPDRYSRHYADVARLLEHPGAVAFLADKTLCARVAGWKSQVFARGWARYDLARHGTFRLVPAAPRLEALAGDYSRMRPMFLREPPPFDEVMRQLAAAELVINSL